MCIHQSQSPNSSHSIPCLPPWCPSICSVHLDLYFCFANRSSSVSFFYKFQFKGKLSSPSRHKHLKRKKKKENVKKTFWRSPISWGLWENLKKPGHRLPMAIPCHWPWEILAGSLESWNWNPDPRPRLPHSPSCYRLFFIRKVGGCHSSQAFPIMMLESIIRSLLEIAGSALILMWVRSPQWPRCGFLAMNSVTQGSRGLCVTIAAKHAAPS